MSGQLPPGVYQIRAIVGNRFAGVTPNRPTDLPVRVDGPVNLWRVEPQPEPGFYRLSLLGAYPFTGVDDKTVVATQYEDRDVNWLITYHSKLQAYTIAEGSVFPLPTPAWTVSSDGSIKISYYEILPGKDQLFTFETPN